MKWFVWILVGVLCMGGALVAAVETVDVVPRRLAPYVAMRASGHQAAIEHVGSLVADALLAVDRGPRMPALFGVTASAHLPAAPGDDSRASASVVLVGSTEEALQAIAHASPGDAITFLPGTYRFNGSYIAASRSGSREAPITVRSVQLGSTILEFNMVEGFLVSAPYWTFENLVIRGACAAHSSCEHAFHVVGGAHHFVARHNDIVDFNAHFKINGSHQRFPDSGVIEANRIRNESVRDTGNPVTLIDLVAASHWRIRGNRISDFAKGQSDGISYGAFAKGGGSDNRFEQNVVLCEERLIHVAGQRVGLSLGGGGTGRSACRDGRCITEQDQGVVAANLIAFCSDDGIYLNRAAMSSVSHNTLVDTGGITVRFAESSADVEGNLVDGVVRARAGAALHAHDNVTTDLAWLYLGVHPVRRLFADALALDLRWRSDPPRRVTVEALPPDLCGPARSTHPAYGAFDAFERCTVQRN